MSRHAGALQPENPELRFRRPMAVRKVLVFQSGAAYPVCPRCERTLEREYQSFCDRCGQQLDWRDFDSALILAKFFGISD